MATSKKLDREGNFVFVGTYDLGDEVVGLLAEVGGLGGCLHIAYSDGSGMPPKHSKVAGIPYIVVGIEYRRWSHVLEVLLHECFEFMFMRLGLRYKCAETWTASHASYNFFMSHEQFADAMAKGSLFLAQSQLDLCRIFRHFRARKNKP